CCDGALQYQKADNGQFPAKLVLKPSMAAARELSVLPYVEPPAFRFEYVNVDAASLVTQLTETLLGALAAESSGIKHPALDIVEYPGPGPQLRHLLTNVDADDTARRPPIMALLPAFQSGMELPVLAADVIGKAAKPWTALDPLQ